MIIIFTRIGRWTGSIFFASKEPLFFEQKGIIKHVGNDH